MEGNEEGDIPREDFVKEADAEAAAAAEPLPPSEEILPKGPQLPAPQPEAANGQGTVTGKVLAGWGALLGFPPDRVRCLVLRLPPLSFTFPTT